MADDRHHRTDLLVDPLRNPFRIPLLLSTGIILGLARFHRGSTTTSIVAHMTNNLPAAVVLILGS